MNIPFRYIGVALLSLSTLIAIMVLSFFSGNELFLPSRVPFPQSPLHLAATVWFFLSITFPHLVWYWLTKTKLFGVKENAQAKDYFSIAVVQLFTILLFVAIYFVTLVGLSSHNYVTSLLLYSLLSLPVLLLLASVPAITVQNKFPNKSTAYVYKLVGKVLVLTICLYTIGAGVLVSIRAIQDKRARVEKTTSNSTYVATQSQKPAINANFITLPNGNSYSFGTYADEFSPSGKKVAFFDNRITKDTYGNYTLYVYDFETKEVKTLLNLSKEKTFYRCVDAPKDNARPCGDLGAPGIETDIKWLSESSLEVWYYDEHFYFDSNKVQSIKKVFSL